jgi:aldehyde dehydrogenase (NAD+)
LTAEEATRYLPPSRYFIDGRYVESNSSALIEIHNPANGELLTSVPDATTEDVDHAVAAARRSFENESWRGKNPSEKERVLFHVAELMEKHKEELAALESLENGKTFREALSGDINPGIDAFRYYAGWVRRIYGETVPVDGPFLNYTLREPVGVVGAIVPWNYPTCIATWKIAPARAAVADLLDSTRAAAAHLGCADDHAAVEALLERGTGADEQRRIHADGGSLLAVAQWLAAETGRGL